MRLHLEERGRDGRPPLRGCSSFSLLIAWTAVQSSVRPCDRHLHRLQNVAQCRIAGHPALLLDLRLFLLGLPILEPDLLGPLRLPLQDLLPCSLPCGLLGLHLLKDLPSLPVQQRLRERGEEG